MTSLNSTTAILSANAAQPLAACRGTRRVGSSVRPSPHVLAGGADPVNSEVGQSVGGLGLMMHNRRRNRVNSTVVARNGSRLTLRVDQAFGNCPKYIQVRAPDAASPSRPSVSSRGTVGGAVNARGVHGVLAWLCVGAMMCRLAKHALLQCHSLNVM